MKYCEPTPASFVEECEAIGCRWAQVHFLQIGDIRYFITHLKAGLYKTKNEALASLAYTTGRRPSLNKSGGFYEVMKTTLAENSLAESWKVLETILSYHAFYGGKQ